MVKKHVTIAPLSKTLQLNEDGIWVSTQTSPVMYPEDGNAYCWGLEDNSFWFHHRNECIVSVIKLFPPAGTILDVGGGNGFVTKRILSAGYNASLLEPGKVGAANAKFVRKIPEVINATFEDASFPPETLSAVGLFDVLEHIQDDVEFLHRIRTVLQPNGLIYATAPAHQSLWSASDVYAGHFRRYNHKLITTLAVDQLVVRYFTYFFGVLILPIFLFRTIPYLSRAGRKKSLLSGKSEHGIGGGRIINMLSALLKQELRSISSGKQLQLGASCLWVLQKKT